MGKLSNRDKQFILDPDRWPQWPVLPIKRTDDTAIGMECAFLVECGHPIEPVQVYKGSIFAISKENHPQLLKEYPTVDALLADGWRVD